MTHKPPRDTNKLGAFIVDRATREGDATLSEKRADAGSLGGQARAKKTTQEKTEIKKPNKS